MKMKRFKALREAAAKEYAGLNVSVRKAKGQEATRDHESAALAGRTDNEQEFVNDLGLDKAIHPNANEKQFVATTGPGKHEGVPGETNPVTQGSSNIKDTDKKMKQTPGNRGDNLKNGDMKAKTATNITDPTEVIEQVEIIEMNEDVMSSLRSLSTSNKSGVIKFKNGETGQLNSKSAGQILSLYNKLTPDNADKMKSQMNRDVVNFMKVLHFADKNVKVA